MGQGLFQMVGRAVQVGQMAQGVGLKQRRAALAAEGGGAGVAVAGAPRLAFGGSLTREGQMSFDGFGQGIILPRLINRRGSPPGALPDGRP